MPITLEERELYISVIKEEMKDKKPFKKQGYKENLFFLEENYKPVNEVNLCFNCPSLTCNNCSYENFLEGNHG